MTLPAVAASDPGFRYGLGIFETLRVKNGKVLLEEEHRGIFIRSAKALELPEIGWEKLGREGQGDGLWRWFHTPETTFSTFESGEPQVPESYRLALSPHRISSGSWEARYKTLSYLLRWQARREAEAAGLEETVLCNERGELCGASMANLFWVQDGMLYTPHEEAGCRAGVVRSWVMAQRPVERVQATPETLTGAEELFLTNSRIGIMPVTGWAGRELAPGPVAQSLRSAYSAKVG